MGRVMFTSDHALDRAENLRAVWDRYTGEKEFVRDTRRMSDPEGFSVVVCDTLPRYIRNKTVSTIVINHSMVGGKLYGLHEKRAGIEEDALRQTDWLITTSEWGVPIAASQFGISQTRVLPYGLPRTDAYIGKKKGDGGTPLASKRAYLYVPTYRSRMDGGHLARIDWARLDSLMEDDEVICIKRHYFESGRMAPDLPHIMEVEPSGPTAPWLIDCDVTVTDYSTTVFDGYLLGKPSVLLTDDMDTYLSNRGMYLAYPFEYGSRWIDAEGHEKELLEMLREAHRNGMRRADFKCRETLSGACDGHASERVCDLIGRLA